jgi:hypothetical protein
MKAQKGRVDGAATFLEGERLKVRLSVLVEGSGTRTAYLPEREVAALLPRGLLANSTGPIPPEFLDTLEPILVRRLKGRTVRLWRWRERSYASFLPWRSVRFADPPAAEQTAATEGPATVPSPPAGGQTVRPGLQDDPDGHSDVQ